jgi:hypothetical protein
VRVSRGTGKPGSRDLVEPAISDVIEQVYGFGFASGWGGNVEQPCGLFAVEGTVAAAQLAIVGPASSRSSHVRNCVSSAKQLTHSSSTPTLR